LGWGNEIFNLDKLESRLLTMKKIKALTLVEILVSLAVFGFVMAACGGILFSVYKSWVKQRDNMQSIENARWPMEFTSRYIRHGGDADTPGAPSDEEKLRIKNLFGSGDDFHFRVHKEDSLYCGPGSGVGIGKGISEEFLSNSGACPNENGNDFFDVSGKLVTLEFSLGDNSVIPPRVHFHCRTKVRLRN